MGFIIGVGIGIMIGFVIGVLGVSVLLIATNTRKRRK